MPEATGLLEQVAFKSGYLLSLHSGTDTVLKRLTGIISVKPSVRQVLISMVQMRENGIKIFLIMK